MEKPDYIIKFQRPKNTEVKYINGHWYLYERSSRYDPKTKKMHKVSGQLLGSITEEGFKPKKQKVAHKIFENVEVVELGATGYLWMNNQEYEQCTKTCYTSAFSEGASLPLSAATLRVIWKVTLREAA